jgi:putative oxidoreductase
MAAAFAITAEGPGAFALDRRQWGTGWALAELVAGVGGAAALLRWANSQQQPQPEPQPSQTTPEPAQTPAGIA